MTVTPYSRPTDKLIKLQFIVVTYFRNFAEYYTSFSFFENLDLSLYFMNL